MFLLELRLATSTTTHALYGVHRYVTVVSEQKNSRISFPRALSAKRNDHS
jgi:hypothetical protein